jgi:hypothetical protein
MKGWLVSVAVLFVLAEILLWLKDFMLPLPIYLLGGAFLAIASNYDRGMNALFKQEPSQSLDTVSQTATLVEKVELFKPQSTSLSFVSSERQRASEMALAKSTATVKQEKP